MKFAHLSIFLVLLVQFFSSFGQEVKRLDWAELQKTEPWKASEQWEPVPEKVNPGQYTTAPSDAIILFDGSDLSHWKNPRYDYGARMDEVESILNYKVAHLADRTEAEWILKDGAMVVKPGAGAIETEQSFGDIQLHLEWLAPVDPGKEGQGYSNSGVFLMGLYEIQVLNSYENATYVNGQAGSMYKQNPPMVNASRPPGEWQSYDIVFHAPTFNDDGEILAPATITAFHNGVLVQDHFELKGPCVYIGEPFYTPHPAKLPLLLQDHGNKVRFRNIWVREL